MLDNERNIFIELQKERDKNALEGLFNVDTMLKVKHLELVSALENLKKLEIKIIQSEAGKNTLSQEISNQREKFFEEYKIIQDELISMVGKINQQDILLREKEEEMNSSIERHHREFLVKDVMIFSLQEKENQQQILIQSKEHKIVELQNQVSSLSAIIPHRDFEIELMKESKFWKLRDIYMRGKWSVKNPLKFLKKHIWSGIPTYPQIAWAMSHPLKFVKKYVKILLGNSGTKLPQVVEKIPLIFEGELGKNEISVIVHLYHVDTWIDIREKLKNIPYEYTLIVSLVKKHYTEQDIKKIKQFHPKVKIVIFENKGLDILPFLKCLQYVPRTTKYLLKIHSKKSPHMKEGDDWRNNLLENVLPSSNKIDLILHNLEYTDIGMIGGSSIGYYGRNLHSSEMPEPGLDLIYSYTKEKPTDFYWIPGTMFWVRFDLLSSIDDAFIKFIEKHQPVGYRENGTIVHGLERYFGKLVYDAGKILSMIPVDRYSKNYITCVPEKSPHPAHKDIYVFFHICCIGDYIKTTKELIDQLIFSGLYQKVNKVFFSIIGIPQDDFLQSLNSYGKFECIYSSSNLIEFEYPTLFLLQEFCMTHDVYVLYFHTKGVSDPDNTRKILWRERLVQKTILEHATCISLLNKGCDISGSGWKEHPYNDMIPVPYTIFKYSHFSGNFWWANSLYICTLPDLKTIESEVRHEYDPSIPVAFDNYRVYCEIWIGMQKDIRVGVNGDINIEYKTDVLEKGLMY
jgi:hypothetical protein